MIFFLLTLYLYKKLIKINYYPELILQNLDNLDKDEILRLQTKKLGYDILLNTMSEYLINHNNISFEDFLERMWKQDYIIYQKSINNIDGFNRDYSEWRDLFNMMLENK